MPAHGPNIISFDELKTVASLLGSEAGKGKDTQVRFFMKIVEAAYQNAIDLTENKHGQDIDDATALTNAYVAAQGTATIFDAKAPNQRKAVSCARTCIKLGQWPKGGSGEPLATVGNLMTMRQNFRKDPAKAKLLDDAANTLLRYARKQMRQDTLIDSNGLSELCFKKQPDARSAEEIIASARKSLNDLISGKAAKGTAQDVSPKVKAAAQALTDRLTEIAKAKGKAKGPALVSV